ncbi:MAG: hypothetical protein ABIL68_15495, partial [bacterium]
MTEEKKYRAFITYVGDLSYNPPGGIILVADNADYVWACHKLSLLMISDDNLKIWVRSKNHFAWLRDFAEQIGYPAYYEEKTALLVLVEQWNVCLPEWLTDTDVLEHKLLEISVNSQISMDFETRFLSHFLGTIFHRELFSASDLVPILMTVVIDDAKKLFKEHPLLSRSLKTKCDQWAERSSEGWIKEACKRISEDCGQVWKSLSLWSGLYGYPDELLEYVLTPEEALFVRKIPIEAVRDLPFESEAREQILSQIEFLFAQINEQVSSSNEFQKVVGWTSGRLFQEFKMIHNIVNSNQFEPTEKDIESVQEKFKSCPGVSGFQLKSLINRVKPAKPTILREKEIWDHTEWIEWVTKRYTPYRSWQIHNNYYDEEVEQTVARFSDWYLEEYVSIHKDPDLSLAFCLREIPQKTSERDFTIILIIDCLPLAFMGIVEDSLRNIGLNRHSLRYKFAGLPTITEFNKAAILSGEWLDKAGSYEAVLKIRSESDWSGKNVVYLNNLKSLGDMTIPKESTIAVLNFLAGDELLHSDVESLSTSHEEEFHRLLVHVSETVNKLLQKWDGPKDLFSIYLVTDHGACRILEEEKRSFDSSVVNKLFSDEKYRFSSVVDGQENLIPENLWLLGHRFKRPFSSDKKSYFLPKGHNTVRQAGSKKVYMHGGVTPEEVIIPFALYKLMKAAWKTIASRFLYLELDRESGRAKFYIQRVIRLEIEIQNPNVVEIRVLRATVKSPENDLKGYKPIVVPAGSTNVLEMNCYF